MKTAEERLTEKFPNAATQDWFVPISECIRQAQIEAINECIQIHYKARIGKEPVIVELAMSLLIDQVK